MTDKFIKNINLQNVKDKEGEVYKLSLKNLKQPLQLLDNTTSLLLKTMRLALNMYKNTNSKQEKDFLTVLLNISNQLLTIQKTKAVNWV